jgi:hypothetical protein
VAAIAVIDVNAADAGELFEIGDHRAKRVAVEWVAGERLGVEHELPALGLCDGGDNRYLASELVSGAGLASTDAFDLRSVQRIDLPPALALILMAHPEGLEKAAERNAL